MLLRCLVVLVVTLAGCSGPAQPAQGPTTLPADAASDTVAETQGAREPCFQDAAPQSRQDTVGAGAHYLKTPNGGASWDTRLFKFLWADDRDRIAELRVVVEWDDTVGSEKRLRMGIENPDARSMAEHWAHGPYNGPSPIDVTVLEPNVTAIGSGIVIGIGTASDGPSSVALVDHDVTVTLYQRYRC